MPTVLMISPTDTDPWPLDLKLDAPMELVSYVLHNALLVKNLSTTVPFASKEESTNQNVTAQMVNTLMLTELAKTVTSNVKLATLTIPVLIVLIALTEPPHPIVSV
jgi:hypothetical protein